MLESLSRTALHCAPPGSTRRREGTNSRPVAPSPLLSLSVPTRDPGSQHTKPAQRLVTQQRGSSATASLWKPKNHGKRRALAFLDSRAAAVRWRTVIIYSVSGSSRAINNAVAYAMMRRRAVFCVCCTSDRSTRRTPRGVPHMAAAGRAPSAGSGTTYRSSVELSEGSAQRRHTCRYFV